MASSEIWKITPEGLHEVSSMGRVRSLPRDIWCMSRGGRQCKRRIAGKLLKPKPLKEGYLVVRMAPGDKTALISRLVCTAFHGPAPSEDAEADHKNHAYPVGTHTHHI